MEIDKDKLQRLISLTYDNDPEVRKKAAVELSKINDPAASLALIELMYDKDKEVAETARKAIEDRKKKEPELIPLAEMFKGVDFSGGKEDKKVSLGPLAKIFERSLGKEEFEKIRPKMEEAYSKSGRRIQALLETYFKNYINVKKRDGRDKRQVRSLFKDVKQEKEGETNNLFKSEGIQGSGKDREYLYEGHAVDGKVNKAKSTAETNYENIQLDLAEVGGGETSIEEELSLEVEKELKEGFEDREVGKKIHDFSYVDEVRKTVVAIAYEAMMLSEGDEIIAKKTAKVMKDFFSKQVDIAFKIAKRKFRKKKITRLPDIKEGMRSVYTDPLTVVDINEIVVKKGRKEDVVRRLVVKDKEGNEGVVYLFDNRGKNIQKGLSVRVEGGLVKFFKFSGETAIVVKGKRAKLVAEF